MSDAYLSMRDPRATDGDHGLIGTFRRGSELIILEGRGLSRTYRLGSGLVSALDNVDVGRRAVVRRAERTLTLLDETEPLDNPHVKPFINRLSDLLYLLARWEEKEQGRPLRHPEV